MRMELRAVWIDLGDQSVASTPEGHLSGSRHLLLDFWPMQDKEDGWGLNPPSEIGGRNTPLMKIDTDANDICKLNPVFLL